MNIKQRIIHLLSLAKFIVKQPDISLVTVI